MVSYPPAGVCKAFGADAEHLRRLVGGQGQTWYDGALVLKPVPNPAEHDWVSDVFAGWRHHDRVRVPEPVRSRRGAWVHDGWAAHHWVEGRDVALSAELDVVRAASDAFHEAVGHLSRPAFLDLRWDPWSHGDRVAWDGGRPQGHAATRQLIADGLVALQPVHARSQVIHGDIGGNVLVADGLAPAVIDWPPYFRPAGFALAVVAVDAICWAAAPLTILDAWSDVPDWDQLLLRAVIYRVATRGRFEALGLTSTDSSHDVEQCRPCLDAVLRRMP